MVRTRKFFCFAVATSILMNGLVTAQAESPVPNQEAVVFSTNNSTSMVIKADGSLWGWGSNSFSVLGNGGKGNSKDSNNCIYQTTPIKIMDCVKAACTGEWHTVALKTDGTLWTWGSYLSGAIGNGRAEGLPNNRIPDQKTPTKIMSGVKDISSGDRYTMALKTDESLWTWGDNSLGQLGNGGKGNQEKLSGYYQTTPVKIMDKVKQICAAEDHAMALKDDGTLWAWGNNNYNQLGAGNKGSYSSPVKILDDVETFDMNFENGMAIKKDGSLWGWGDNWCGQMGNGVSAVFTDSGASDEANSTNQALKAVLPVKIMDNVKIVRLGESYVMAIKNDNTLWGWGENRQGQIGMGTVSRAQATPVQVMDGVKSVFTGGKNVQAIKLDSSLWSWGDNKTGAVGNGGKGDQKVFETPDGGNTWNCQATPTKIMEGVAKVYNSYGVSAIKMDGSLWTWGVDWYGSLGNGRKGDIKDQYNNPCRTIPVKILDGVKK